MTSQQITFSNRSTRGNKARLAHKATHSRGAYHFPTLTLQRSGLRRMADRRN